MSIVISGGNILINVFVMCLCFIGSTLAMIPPKEDPVLCYLTFAGLYAVPNVEDVLVDFDASSKELLEVIEKELMRGGVSLSNVEADMEFDDQDDISKEGDKPTQKRSISAIDSKAYNPFWDKQ